MGDSRGVQELNFQPLAPGEPRPFWEHPVFLAFLVVASAAPLLWPDIAPLVDLPGHMGRYRVQLDLGTSPALQQFYGYEWALIGNLGVDLLVELLAPLMGLEPAVRLIVLLIPPLTAAGLIWAAFEVHGRVPPTVLFALPFAYNFPFLFGFVNFALAMALALNAFALWLRLGRLHQVRLRAILFVPISLHPVGRPRLRLGHAWACSPSRPSWSASTIAAAAISSARSTPPSTASSLALPFVMMVYWRSNAGGQTGDWFNWQRQGDVAVHVAARPLGDLRHRRAGDRRVDRADRRLGEPPHPIFAQPRRLGALPAARLLPAAAGDLRLGLCRHAARPLHLRHRPDRDPLPAAPRAGR